MLQSVHLCCVSGPSTNITCHSWVSDVWGEVYSKAWSSCNPKRGSVGCSA